MARTFATMVRAFSLFDSSSSARAICRAPAVSCSICDEVADSGTGRWAVEYALGEGIPVPAISVALYERFDSRLPKRYAHQVIAALRQQFGGHAIKET